jgi:LmbE family N-acetylglucosaminyl deacetylase
VNHVVKSIEELINPSRHVFLSPHYDDIAISCGGTARLLADHGRQPIVALIFGSEPASDYRHTAFAEQMHRDWGLDASSVIASRRAEEAVASRVLGTTDQFLPFHDAIYRGERYLGDVDLFSIPTDDEMELLPTAIAEAAGLTGEPDGDTRIYTPLGAGKHVDHQLAFATGVELAHKGWDVWFYEDLPYSIKPGVHADRIATSGVALVEAAHIDVSSVWTAKIDAIMSYPSQLETVFGRYIGAGSTREEIDAVMRQFATGIDGQHAIERFWRV